MPELESAHARSPTRSSTSGVGEGEAFVHSWEDRFVVQEGYVPRIVEAVAGLLEKTRPQRCGRLREGGLYAPDARSHASGAAARALGLETRAAGDRSSAGSATPGPPSRRCSWPRPWRMRSPGRPHLVANYGDGAEALAFSGPRCHREARARGAACRGTSSGASRGELRPLHIEGAGPRRPRVGGRQPGPGLSATIHSS